MNDESKLIKRLKAGDSPAFEALVAEYGNKLYSMAVRYTGSSQDAQDICQEVFLRVFRFIDGFGGSSALSTWIYRIAINVCKDFSTKKNRLSEVPLEVEADGESFEINIADERFSPETQLENKEMRLAIERAVESLPEKYREVIILRDINGLSYEQIGEALGLESGTVKSRISRARERMRVFLLAQRNLSGPALSNTVKGGPEA